MLFWSRLGVVVGFLGLSYVLLVEFLQDSRIYRDYSSTVSTGLILVGFFLGWSGYRQAQHKADEMEREDLGGYAAAFKFLANGRQQIGLLSACLGVIGFILVPPTFHEPLAAPAVPPQPEQTNAPPQSVETNEPPPTVEIPNWPLEPLNIQGLNLNRNRPSIIVDEKTYEVGEMLQGAKILDITRNFITVEYYGVRQTYKLPEF